MSKERKESINKTEPEKESRIHNKATQKAKNSWSGHSFVPRDLEYMESYYFPRIDSISTRQDLET